ncbi:MAG TPA: TMEM175 family protein [Puia sp.]|nr:TMEM175 family protein [Puia sp.]
MSKSIHAPAHDRKQFQIDRIAFYSDAIIAIASTLLILEFKIPPLGRDHSWSDIQKIYGGKLLIPILGLIISFYTISLLWMKHHTLFEKVTGYNRRLLIINQAFLFMIMIIPVSTSFMLDDNPLSMRIVFYFSNLGLCNLMYFLLLVTALRPANGLSGISVTEYHAIRKKDRSLYRGLSFLLAAILAIFTIKYFYLAFIPSILLRSARHLVLLKNFFFSRKKH